MSSEVAPVYTATDLLAYVRAEYIAPLTMAARRHTNYYISAIPWPKQLILGLVSPLRDSLIWKHQWPRSSSDRVSRAWQPRHFDYNPLVAAFKLGADPKHVVSLWIRASVYVPVATREVVDKLAAFNMAMFIDLNDKCYSAPKPTSEDAPLVAPLRTRSDLPDDDSRVDESQPPRGGFYTPKQPEEHQMSQRLSQLLLHQRRKQMALQYRCQSATGSP
ncbi:hypothetical protein H257_12036 [Aphanomyces astaci]|uniref:Uncharacterized protein n=1 Tax=Aphanomyces astaci TaxID=112090 RepID=W4FZU8_APHAT|nr:hypothetical protein H257_12036 [Aphanomyces astaci]ETV72990.1 hypothetical protein H257_12036 [Aphanomyces astaci]|eukprot:XP_009837439.1 hypothetical protein H257_12036 [Aphanomyces astaci]